MYVEQSISVVDFVSAISEAVELVSPVTNDHHKKVACIACSIAQEMELPLDEIQDVVLAALLHDIGAFSLDAHFRRQVSDFYETEQDHHALLGYKLLKDFAPLRNAAHLIRYHHEEYVGAGKDIPVGSHIIHLADRVAILLDNHHEIFEQLPGMLDMLSRRKGSFHPAAFGALKQLAKREYLWIEAFSSAFSPTLYGQIPFTKEISGIDTLQSFARVVAHVIDFRSRFTATHSSGVAAVAAALTAIAGFSERECRLMEVAGLLHDLGKLAVPNEILEKNGTLDSREFNTIKKHTYYTFVVLNKIKGLDSIAAWAAHHHERQDGNGYPFHVKGNDFSMLSRVMAVADVTTALTEDRPYRAGMGREETIHTLSAIVKNGGIDKHIADLVYEHFAQINDVRAHAQSDAQKEFSCFYSLTPHNACEDDLLLNPAS